MLEKKINKYKHKYYFNLLLRGVFFSLISLLSLWLIISTFEYFGRLSSWVRGTIFYLFLFLACSIFYIWILRPLISLLNSSKYLSNVQAAKNIGNHFPDIQDKLLNTLQIKHSKGSSELITAAINQSTGFLQHIDFSKAVSYGENKRYLIYFISIACIFFICILWIPEFLTESTTRIIHYDRKFNPEAPFSFQIRNPSLEAFKNENFILNLQIEGKIIPSKVFVHSLKDRLKMTPTTLLGVFEYEFKNIQKDIIFSFEAAGFASSSYKIIVLQRPNLKGFEIFANYPDYTGKIDEKVKNIGNLILPEGTFLKWDIHTSATDSVWFSFDNGKKSFKADQYAFHHFTFSERIHKSLIYQMKLANQHSENKDVIEYFLEVIPDQYPYITLEKEEDTILYSYIFLNGNISDDYGISSLVLYYKNLSETNTELKDYHRINLPFNEKVTSQSFFYQFDIDTLLDIGEVLTYFVEVKDNDQVNGFKSRRSTEMKFQVPNRKLTEKAIEKTTQQTQSQFSKTVSKAQEFQKILEILQEYLRGKKKLDWQAKKALEELLREKDKLIQEIVQLKNLNQQLNNKQIKFNSININSIQKIQQLQELISKILDPKIQTSYEELSKLLKEDISPEDLEEVLEELKFNQKNLTQELNRSSGLFEKLKFDIKANKISEELENLSQKQKKLAQESLKKHQDSSDSIENDIFQEQQDINREFEEITQNLKDLQEINRNLENNARDLHQFERPQKEIKQLGQESIENLIKQQYRESNQSQNKSAKKMKQLAKNLKSFQKRVAMGHIMENYNDLRQILDNLMILSFTQEELMKSYGNVNRIDSKFIELGRKQLKLKDDAQLVQDSLFSLSKRMFQLESFVTREVNLMNKYINESLEAIKKRIPHIVSAKQQFAMTSINNLALLLNSSLQQTQLQLSTHMLGQQMNQKQDDRGQLSKLQKQLNQKIDEIRKSEKEGIPLSEELAKLAAHQEVIRNLLKNHIEAKSKKIEENYGDILRKMEKTEEDLVNKKITQETILRQKQILTRLLESEKVEKEREVDSKREAKSARQDYSKIHQKTLLQYLKLKQIQTEFFKTLPTSLSPYYKKEVSEYFDRIKDHP